jgi:hypothetical protein
MFVLMALCIFFFYTMRKDSADGRLFVWKISTEMLRDFSLTGTGLDGYKAHYMNYQAKYFAKNNTSTQETMLSDNIVYTFNDFLQFFIEEGIIGLLLLVALLWLIFKQYKNAIYYMSTALIISLSVFACFSYPLQILPLKLIVFTAIAFSAFTSKNKQEFKLRYTFIRLQIFSTATVWVALQFYNAYRLHIGYSIWKKAFNTYQEMNFKESSLLFEKAYPYLKSNGEFLMHYGKALSLDEQPNLSNIILHKAEQYLNNTVIQTSLGDNYVILGNYPQAIKHFRKACNMTPNRLYPRYLLMKLYEKKGDIVEARKEAVKLLQIPIKVPSITTSQIIEEAEDLLNINNKEN